MPVHNSCLMRASSASSVGMETLVSTNVEFSGMFSNESFVLGYSSSMMENACLLTLLLLR